MEILYGYLFTLRGFLEEKLNTQYKDRVQALLDITNNLISDTDFSYLYNKENRLLSIGFNSDEITTFWHLRQDRQAWLRLLKKIFRLNTGII